MLQVEVKRTIHFLPYAENNLCENVKMWRKAFQTKEDISRFAYLSVKSHTDSPLEIFKVF